MISHLQGWAANWTGAGGAGDLQLFTSLPSKSMFLSRALPVRKFHNSAGYLAIWPVRILSCRPFG